jgi:hypothetical protein
MGFTTPSGPGSRPQASTRYARSDPRAATAALGDGKTHGPSLGGSIMYQSYSKVTELSSPSITLAALFTY